MYAHSERKIKTLNTNLPVGDFSHASLGRTFRGVALGAVGLLSGTIAAGATNMANGASPVVDSTNVELVNRLPDVDYMRAVRVKNCEQLTAIWNSDNRLFVKGDMKVSPDDVIQIGRLLKEHKDWTVLLSKDSYNEQFTSQDGATHVGYDAMLFRLGQVLGNSYEFKQRVDSKTFEPSGAILVICLDHNPEHGQVGYYAEPARDSLDVGHLDWKNGLDDLALSHLRDGKEDILGAVHDTITSIDSLYGLRQASGYINNQTKLLIAECIGGLTILGIVLWLGRNSSGGSSYYYDSSSSDSGGGSGDSGFSSSGF